MPIGDIYGFHSGQWRCVVTNGKLHKDKPTGSAKKGKKAKPATKTKKLLTKPVTGRGS
jgi:hypothetical protein